MSSSERCDHCSSPVATSQRYCVQCGAHLRRRDDPTARWFAAARRAKHAPSAVPAAARDGAIQRARTTQLALAIALLPVAAGVGVLVGRSTDDSGRQVLEALKAVGVGTEAEAVSSGPVAPSTPDAATVASGSAAEARNTAAKTTKKVEGIELTDQQAPVLATGPTGSARKLTGTKPTGKDLDESKQALKQIESKKGEAYVEQQKDLPDTIVIP
ncbi:MAG: zinc ribbon domain-containing protein [Patulibacter sp.]